MSGQCHRVSFVPGDVANVCVIDVHLVDVVPRGTVLGHRVHQRREILDHCNSGENIGEMADKVLASYTTIYKRTKI